MEKIKKQKKSFPLYMQILAGMIAGILIGLIALPLKGERFVQYWIVPWGQLFIRLLQLIAMPLIFVSLIKGIIGLENIKSFSRLGLKTILLYLSTTVVAVILGLSIGLIAKPGNLADKAQIENLQGDYELFVAEKKQAAEETYQQGPLGFLNDIIPNNIIDAASNNSGMLQVIFFAVFFAIAALAVPKEKTETAIRFFNELNEIIFRMVDYIISFAPVGVTALMAGLVVSYGGEMSIFIALGAYALCVVGAIFVMIFLFYPLLIRMFSNTPVKKFLRAIYPVQLFAFTTSSSAATLPYTMETVEKELGVSKETASFVLPVGTTINMDGTSCYQTISILFIAQILGMDLSLQQIFVVIGMTILSSIGTPAIPGGSFVILTMVLASVGIPPEGLALIIGIDRPLDMLRTAVNVTGDAVVSVIVDNK
ncbi:MAG: dicarboxylate/amino acid:cation symporter [Tannerella sp.]|jgi:Na+/H+-dicarboxylate symporter|nr:dicarboxylate/amino acid:cation symporter [Tannerella sp.]